MSGVEPKVFFVKRRDESEIRSELLFKILKAWAQVVQSATMLEPTGAALYIDLISGSKKNADEQAEPIKILNYIFKSSGTRSDLNKFVKTFLSDPGEHGFSSLKSEVGNLAFVKELAHEPLFLDEEVHCDLLVNLLTEGLPALASIDPFRDSTSQILFPHLLKNEEAAIFMLLDYSCIESAVRKAKADPFVLDTFGDRLSKIKAFYKHTRQSAKREEFVIVCLKEIFRERGFYILDFRIAVDKEPNRYLFFASRAELAFTRIKEILVDYSDFQEDGVPLLGANLKQTQLSLFKEHYTYSIANLTKDLADKKPLYHNKLLEKVYEMHNAGTNYIKDNYKAAFEKLREQGKVVFVNPQTGQTISKVHYNSLIRYK